jgi:hypothetical protein
MEPARQMPTLLGVQEGYLSLLSMLRLTFGGSKSRDCKPRCATPPIAIDRGIS